MILYFADLCRIRIRLFLFSFLTFYCALCDLGWPQTEELAAAVHIHSSISSGAHTISQIAQKARGHKVDVIILTDLYHEKYEYGVAPLRSLFKMAVERSSVEQYGLEKYWTDIVRANQDIPEVITLDGAVVTPFHYWTGNLWPGPLILNNRGKDLIVFGLKSAAAYRGIPITSKGNSPFTAYGGDQQEKPYQAAIDDVRKKGGFIFWSHPDAEETILLKGPLNLRAISKSDHYEEDVLRTQNYSAIGIYAVQLSQILNPELAGTASPGGLWDKTLTQYLRGKRSQPAWAIGEVDYTGFENANQLIDVIENILLVREKTKEEILNAFHRGKYYVVMRNTPRTRRVLLHDFTVSESERVDAAGFGQEIAVENHPTLHISLSLTDHARILFNFVLIKNGRMVKVWDQETPVDIRFEDDKPSSLSYYRLIGTSEEGDRILTNPVFVRPKS